MNIGSNRLKIIAAARLEVVRPTSLHPAQHAILQGSIRIDLVHGELDEVDVTPLHKLPYVVCEIPRDITNCLSTKAHL